MHFLRQKHITITTSRVSSVQMIAGITGTHIAAYGIVTDLLAGHGFITLINICKIMKHLPSYTQAVAIVAALTNAPNSNIIRVVTAGKPEFCVPIGKLHSVTLKRTIQQRYR